MEGVACCCTAGCTLGKEAVELIEKEGEARAPIEKHACTAEYCV